MDLNELLKALNSLASAMDLQAISYKLAADAQINKDNLALADAYKFASNAWTDASNGVREILAKAELE